MKKYSKRMFFVWMIFLIKTIEIKASYISEDITRGEDITPPMNMLAQTMQNVVKSIDFTNELLKKLTTQIDQAQDDSGTSFWVNRPENTYIYSSEKNQNSFIKHYPFATFLGTALLCMHDPIVQKYMFDSFHTVNNLYYSYPLPFVSVVLVMSAVIDAVWIKDLTIHCPGLRRLLFDFSDVPNDGTPHFIFDFRSVDFSAQEKPEKISIKNRWNYARHRIGNNPWATLLCIVRCGLFLKIAYDAVLDRHKNLSPQARFATGIVAMHGILYLFAHLITEENVKYKKGNMSNKVTEPVEVITIEEETK